MNLSVKDWLWIAFFFFTVAIAPAILGATIACWMYHRSRNVSFDDLCVYASAVSNSLDKIDNLLTPVIERMGKRLGIQVLDVDAKTKTEE